MKHPAVETTGIETTKTHWDHKISKSIQLPVKAETQQLLAVSVPLKFGFIDPTITPDSQKS